jgi:hypothetical protein
VDEHVVKVRLHRRPFPRFRREKRARQKRCTWTDIAALSQYYETQHNVTQHNNTQQSKAQHNIEHKNTQHST